MKKIIASALIATFALAACQDDTQARLEQQQKQIEALQQQLAQQADDTVYQLTPEAVKDTIPAEAQANGNNGQPVTGKDGQQYIYDQSTGSWLLQSLVGAAAGAFIGNALANKFTRAGNQDSPVARR
ncbi:membrane lipoprotein lipid attachment site-containing protein, partial [Neisseria meningitidis]|nr:membrane lipoprotein lipid attachment site-containing protein [Neisseria meningitidis]